MKNLLILFLITLTLFWGCDKKPTDINLPPQKVRWVVKTPDAYPGVERGIDAFGGNENSLILEWYAVPDNDVVKYNIYATNQVLQDNTNENRPINFIIKKELLKDNAGQDDNFRYNLYADSAYYYYFDLSQFGFAINQKCYFYILAEDDAGNISERSDTLNYTLMEAPSLLDYLSGDQYFTWQWPSIIPENIIFRLEQFPYSGPPLFITAIAGYENIVENYYEGNPRLYLNSLNVNLVPGQTYRFRIDVYESEFKGGESSWKEFQY